MGRPPVGEQAMTSAERKRRQRERDRLLAEFDSGMCSFCGTSDNWCLSSPYIPGKHRAFICINCAHTAFHRLLDHAHKVTEQFEEHSRQAKQRSLA
jgi:hypothetical protein